MRQCDRKCSCSPPNCSSARPSLSRVSALRCGPAQTLEVASQALRTRASRLTSCRCSRISGTAPRAAAVDAAARRILIIRIGAPLPNDRISKRRPTGVLTVALANDPKHHNSEGRCGRAREQSCRGPTISPSHPIESLTNVAAPSAQIFRDGAPNGSGRGAHEPAQRRLVCGRLARSVHGRMLCQAP